MQTIRRRLADATGALHEALDAHAASIDVSATSEPLVAFLARGFVPVEQALERAGAVRILPEWPERRRAHLMGDPAPADRPEATKGDPACAAVEFDSDAEIWGALYVLEGSRIGATLLRRNHRTLAEHPFFAEEKPFWPIFLARLDAADRELADRDGMVAGAQKAFATFL